MMKPASNFRWPFSFLQESMTESHKSTMTLPRYLILTMVALTASVGDTLLAVGAKQLGSISLDHPAALFTAISNPWIIAGIVLLIGFFASYLTALSWADLTYVLPATSLGYIVTALLSKFWLHEHLSAWRWLGILFITAGVGFVTRGPALTEHANIVDPMQAELQEAGQS
jgi:drug/metabolite transporter (DMT)-like permease